MSSSYLFYSFKPIKWLCDSWPAGVITFSAAEHHHCLAGTKLYSLLTVSCVWITCLESLHDSGPARSWTCQLVRLRYPFPSPVHTYWMLQNTERSATFVAHFLCYILLSRHRVHSSMCCWRCLKSAHPRIFWEVLTCHLQWAGCGAYLACKLENAQSPEERDTCACKWVFQWLEVVWLRCSGCNNWIPATTTVMSWCQ